MLFLVRHAKAGKRSAWEADDSERPLNEVGHEQARALVDTLGAELGAAAAPTPSPPASTPRLLSSPFLRCRQTLEPLAAHLDVPVDNDWRLAEGTPFDEVLVLLDELADGSVCCSHGDVIPDVIAALERRGMRITTDPDWRKATTWVLRRDTDGFTAAHVLPPPSI